MTLHSKPYHQSSGVGVKQAWIVYALNIEQLECATILACSLKTAFSNRRILLVAESTLEINRTRRNPYFDEICQVSSPINPYIDAMSLTQFNKVIVLHPRSVVIQNPDLLFLVEANALGHGIAVLKPDARKFEAWYKEPTNTDIPALVSFLDGHPFSNPEWLRVSNVVDDMSPAMIITDNPSIICFERNVLCRNDEIVKNLKSILSYHEVLSREGRIPSFVGSLSHGNGKELIAVVGMSCRLPGANSIDEYWQLLMEGRCSIIPLPKDRWTFPHVGRDISRAEKETKGGFLTCPVDQFDEKFFGISPIEAEYMDPQQRLMLEVAWEALENAGIKGSAIYGSNAGVFVGAWRQDYMRMSFERGLPSENEIRWYTGNNFGNMSSRLSHFLRSTGPSITSEVACTSSSVSCGLAMSALQNGTTNLAIVCGANLLLRPFTPSIFPHILAENFQSKVFDANANGYVRSEGIGVLILKRVSDAIRGGDRILALLRGFGAVQEGTSESIGTPTVDNESMAMQLALNDAGIEPWQVQVVEAHATGTRVGDPVEIMALTKAYSSSKRKTPLIIAGGKGNLGHVESASGIAGLIKQILQLQKKFIPPHVGILNRLNPLIDLSGIPAIIPSSIIPFPASTSDIPRMASVCSFGFTGYDTHIVLQEAPRKTPNAAFITSTKPYPCVPLILSSKSSEALNDLKHKYITSFPNLEKNTIVDIAYSASRLDNFPYRMSTAVSSLTDLVQKLKAGVSFHYKTRQEPPSICFLFTGQGSQYHGMAQILYETCPVFKLHFDSCNKTLQDLCGFRVHEAVFGSDPLLIDKSLYSQSAIFLVEHCLTQLLSSWGCVPKFVLGHSLGEFAAAVAANLISVEGALKLLGARCKLIAELPEGRMLAVKMGIGEIAEFCSLFLENQNQTAENDPAWLDIAAINADEQITLAGTPDTIEKFQQFCYNNGVKATLLQSSHAYHSRMLDRMLPDYADIAKSINYPEPTQGSTFISSLDGHPVGKLNPDYWVRQIRQPVEFLKASLSTINLDPTCIFVEVGPHPILSPLVLSAGSSIGKTPKCFSTLRKPTSEHHSQFHTLSDTLGKLWEEGVPLNWEEFYRFQPKTMVNIPHYAFQRRSFWFQGRNSEGNEQAHHLLGNVFDDPPTLNNGAKFTHFKNLISQQKPSYLGEHKVGEFVIVPAAAFLEICLSAIRTTYPNTHPIILDDFKMIAPLNLPPPAINIELHTLVSTAHDSAVLVAVYSRHYQSANWILHCEAHMGSPSTTSFSVVENMNVLRQRLNSQSRHSNPLPRDIYKKVATIGMNIESNFCSIQNVIYKGEAEHLAEISIPEKLMVGAQVCHPIILDGMLQVIVFICDRKSSTLHLPIGVHKTTIFNTLSTKHTSFIVHHHTSGNGELNATLYAEDGQPLLLLEGVRLVQTNLNNLRNTIMRLDGQQNRLPTIYMQTFENVPAPMYNTTFKDDRIGNTWLIANGYLLGDEIQRNLERTGHTATRVQSSTWDTKEGWASVFTNRDFLANLHGIIYLAKSCFTGAETGATILEETNSITTNFLYMIQTLLENQMKFKCQLPKLAVVTRGQFHLDKNSRMNTTNLAESTISGIFRCYLSENGSATGAHIDLDPDTVDLSSDAASVQLMLNGGPLKEPVIVVRSDGIKCLRLVIVEPKPTFPPLPIDGNRFSLSLKDNGGIIKDLEFQSEEEVTSLDDFSVQVEVRASSLNFRDLFSVMKPVEYFINAMPGADIAGVIVQVGSKVVDFKEGDYVMAVVKFCKMCPSHAILNEKEVVRIPDWMSCAEAASIPICFFTAALCLVNVANLQSGQKVLIHCASGGLGLYVIQLAKNIGVTVFATAGSIWKREYLKSIGVDDVFCSRNTSFAEGVLKATEGRGVDLVINSLTGPGFKEAALSCCAPTAFFVEVSKVNLWTPEEVQSIRPDVQYSIQDIFTMDRKQFREMHATLHQYLIDRKPLPLVNTRFDLAHVRDALTLMKEAKHLGKIVLLYPQDGTTKLFNDRSSYLITGGLGGIGFSVAKWMFKNGAKTIILLGRKPPKKEIQAEINVINAHGGDLQCKMCDVGNESRLSEVFAEIQISFKPIRGVMHCAGLLNDRLIPNQNLKRFNDVFNPKVSGGWNLHQLTKSLKLEHFVLFSSVSAIVGPKGQANYAAANCFLDSLAAYRKAAGLPATTLNWGQWGEVGMAANRSFQYSSPFSVEVGLNALELALRLNIPQMAPMEIKPNEMDSSTPWISPILGRIKRKNVAKESKSLADSKTFLAELTAAGDGIDAKLGVTMKYLLSIWTSVTHQLEEIDPNAQFDDVGLDSLMRIELNTGVRKLIGLKNNYDGTELQEANCLTNLAKIVVESVSHQQLI